MGIQRSCHSPRLALLTTLALVLCPMPGPGAPRAQVCAAAAAAAAARPRVAPAAATPAAAVSLGASASATRTARGTSGRGAVTSRRLGAQSQAAVYGLTTCTTPGGEDDWALWWALNEDEVVWEAPEGQVTRGATTLGGGLAGGRRRDAPGQGASRGQVYTRIVPTLLDLLDASNDPEVLDACALALGSAVEAELAEPVRQRLEPLLAHPAANVATSATLALGLLGDPTAAPMLLDLASCSAGGHDLVGADVVPRRQRAVAALALGYLGHDDIAPNLLDLVERESDSEVELKTCAILALGLIDGPASRAALATLMAELPRRDLDGSVASAIPTAAARAASRELLPDLLALVRDRDTDRRVLQSAVTALGRIADLDDEETVEVLQGLSLEARDGPTRRQAWIALARMGAADPVPVVHGAFHDAFTDDLARALRHPPKDMDRAWIALAAGFYGRDRGGVTARRLAEGLEAVFEDTKDPGVRGALALGAGLVGAQSLAPGLVEALADTHDDLFRSHAALALGMLGHRPAIPVLRDLTEAKGLAAEVRRSAARALGLLADEETARHLARRMTEATSTLRQRECALVLGQLRCSEALNGLRTLAADDDADGLTRAMACGALGRVAEKTERPWASRVCGDLNYLASATTVLDQLPVIP